MSVKVFKMISGEEIISEVFNKYDQTLELKNPATIVLQQTERGVSVGIAPYMAYAGERVHIYRHALAAEGDPDDALRNEYNRIFGSGIQIASASALQGLQK